VRGRFSVAQLIKNQSIDDGSAVVRNAFEENGILAVEG